MRRTIRTVTIPSLLALLVSLCLPLAGCTQDGLVPAESGTSDQVDGPGTPEEVDTSNMAEQKVSPYGLTGMVTMAQYMSERYSSFDRFDAAMQSGSEEPHSLRLYVSGTTDGYVHDQQLMHEFWDELCAVRIDVDHPVSAVIDDGYLSFSFDWNTELIPFPFCTSEYAQFSEGELFPVENPDAVQSLVARLSDLIEEGQTDDELPFEDGAYLWDADGDGTHERVTVSAVDNGDEAPNVLVIRVYGDTMDVEGVIERAYGIEGIRAASDEAGPYLTLHYLEGDYYAHDRIATCMLRVAGDELVVE